MAWDIDFVRQSTILCELRTKPILDVVLSRDALRAAAGTSMIPFSDFRDPFEITSKNLLLSVRSWIVMGRLSTADNSCGKEIAMLDISLKAMTSAAIAVRAMRRDLYV